MLRVKESEVQYLKQEINSLKDELQAAQRVRIYLSAKFSKLIQFVRTALESWTDLITVL